MNVIQPSILITGWLFRSLLAHIVFFSDAKRLQFLRKMTFQADLFVCQPHDMRDTCDFPSVHNTVSSMDASKAVIMLRTEAIIKDRENAQASFPLLSLYIVSFYSV